MKRFSSCGIQNKMVQISRPEKKQKCSYHCTSVCCVESILSEDERILNDDISGEVSSVKVHTATQGRNSSASILHKRHVTESVSSYTDCKKGHIKAKCRNSDCVELVHSNTRSVRTDKLQGSVDYTGIKSILTIKNEGRRTSMVDGGDSAKILECTAQAKRLTNCTKIEQTKVDVWNLFLHLFQDQMYHEYNKNLMKKVICNFVPELMLGIQYHRNNIVCVARLVFKTGVHLYQFDHINEAMYLYDALLVRLLSISGVGKRNDNTPELLGQEKLYDREQTCSLMIANSLYKTSSNTLLVVFPRMMATLKNSGNFHQSIKDVDMALDCFNNVNQVDEVFMKTCHCNMIEALMNIALIHRRRNDWSMALVKYIQVYALKCRVFGPRSLEVATSLSLIALMQYRLKQYSSAYEMYYETLSIEINVLGGVNLCVSSTLNSLGLCCFYLRFFRRAKSFFFRCLKIRQNLCGIDNSDLAIIWYNIGTICIENGDETEAIKCYDESLRIEELTLDCDKSEGIILTLKNLGYIYQRNGEFDEAAQYFTRALVILQNRTCPNPGCIGKMHNILGNIHLQQGNVAEMMNCYINAARCSTQTNDRLVISGYTYYCLSKIHPQCAHVA